jgi:hypothetical protein
LASLRDWRIVEQLPFSAGGIAVPPYFYACNSESPPAKVLVGADEDRAHALIGSAFCEGRLKHHALFLYRFDLDVL